MDFGLGNSQKTTKSRVIGGPETPLAAETMSIDYGVMSIGYRVMSFGHRGAGRSAPRSMYSAPPG
jgi:hypothetical protein